MPEFDWDLDARNAMNIEVARPKGGYEEDLPDGLFDQVGWVCEPKLDGERKTLQFGKTKNWLVSRNRRDKLKGVNAAGEFCTSSESVPWLTKKLVQADLAGTIIDGELVVGAGEVDSSTMVAHFIAESPNKLKFVMFDVLFVCGKDVRGASLEKRRELLTKLVKELDCDKIELIQQFPLDRVKVRACFDEGMEGVVLKNLNAPYLPRVASGWLKWKADKTVDAVIVDVSEAKSGGSPKNGVKPKPNGKAARFKMALVRDGKMIDVGWMSNLDESDQQDGLKRFASGYMGKVAEITVSGWDGRWFRWMRFKCWRTDKSANDCRWADQIGGVNSGIGAEREA